MLNPSTSQRPRLIKPKHGRVGAALSIQMGSLGHTAKRSLQEPEIHCRECDVRAHFNGCLCLISHTSEAFGPTNPTFSDFTQIIWQSTTEPAVWLSKSCVEYSIACVSACTNLLAMWSMLCCQLPKALKRVLHSQIPSEVTPEISKKTPVHWHFKLESPCFTFRSKLSNYGLGRITL